jgi:hypothetical protein
VVEDYVPTAEERASSVLQLRRGDTVEVLDRSTGDWWYGRVGAQEGYFPSEFVSLT